MAAVDEIAIKLGVKTGDLKAALAGANADIKAFKKGGEGTGDDGLIKHMKGVTKQFADFKQMLAASGITAAVVGFFNLAIDAAQKSTDATDTNAAAVRDFAKGLDEVKAMGGQAAVVVVGAFNKIGAAIGDAINIGRSFVENGTQGFEKWADAQDMLTTTAKAAEEAEKRLADLHKKHGAELEAITRELASIEKKAQEQKLKGLDVYETERNLNMHLIELRAKMAAADGDVVAQRRLAVEIAKTQLAVDDATLAVKKDQAAQEKKLADERRKKREEQDKEEKETIKKRSLDIALERELFVIESKRAEHRTEAEKQRLKILTLQKEEKWNQAEIDNEIERSLTDGITPAEEKRLLQLIKQDKKLEEQIQKLVTAKGVIAAMSNLPPTVAPPVAATEEAVDSIIAKWRNFQGSISNQGDVRNLSDTQLKTLIGNLQDKVAEGERKAREGNKNPFDLTEGVSLDTTIYRGNLSAAQKELSLRNQFNSTVSRFGETAAERAFAPGDYERLAGLMNPEAQAKQARDIGTIATTLKNVFPKQAADIRG
jgi:hypothetical protein